jgi:hypothetical protein
MLGFCHTSRNGREPTRPALREAVAGAISPAIATEVLAFLQAHDSLPNADLVRADPDRDILAKKKDRLELVTRGLNEFYGPLDVVIGMRQCAAPARCLRSAKDQCMRSW